MNTTQIQNALAGDPAVKPCFLGVFPSDHLLSLRIKRFPAALVANTDSSDEKGEHWVCFYFDKNGNAEYFDSYGFAPINCNLLQFFESNGKNHTWNKEQLQSVKSTVCGQWCIAYLSKRCRGQSRAQIVQSLKMNTPAQSDQRIGNLVNTAFSIRKTKTLHQDGGGGIHKLIIIQCCCSRVNSCR